MADEARALIDEEMRSLRSRRNALSPICRLPSELLAAIFVYCALKHHRETSSPIYEVPDWVNFSYTCHHWRRVALDCPTLWTYHFVLSLRWTEELLTRSKQAPLKIRITFTRSKPNSWYLRLLEMLMEHAVRLEELDLEFPDNIHSRLLSVLSPITPRLKKLNLSFKRDPPEWSSVPFEGDTPALSSLKLSNSPVPWYLFNLGALTTLSLCRVPNRFRQNTEEFLVTLGSMQNLTELVLTDALRSASPFLSTSSFHTFQKFDLPYLSSLLIVAPLSAVSSLLSCVNIPLDAELRLSCLSEDYSTTDDYALLSSALTQRFTAFEQAFSGPPVRSLIVDSRWTRKTRLTFSALERDCDSSADTSHMEWGSNIPLKLEIHWNEDILNVGHVLGDFCFPITTVQTLHVIYPLPSSAFWSKTLGHLQNLQYLKVSRGQISDLASALSPHSTGTEENQVEHALVGRVLAPSLEKLVLYATTFPMGESSERRLLDALSARGKPQGRLIMNQCKAGTYTRPDTMRSWDGVVSSEDRDRVTGHGFSSFGLPNH